PHPENLTEKAAHGIGPYAKVRHARACPGHPRLGRRRGRKTWMAGTSPAMTKMNHTHVVRNSLKRGPLFDSEERPLGRVSKDDMAHGLAAILRDAARSARLLRMRSKQVLL